MGEEERQRRFDRLNQDLQRRKGQVELVQSSVRLLKTTQCSLDAALALETETAKLFQMASAATWDTTKQLVEGIVTRGLQAIFYDRDYRFLVKQEVKRGASAVTFSVAEGDLDLDLADELGGGICDVVALLLRIAFVYLYRPKVRQVLVLDEPLKHLASCYQPYAAKFLKQVCHEMGLTVLMATHSAELTREADQVFKAQNVNGVCMVEEETI